MRTDRLHTTDKARRAMLEAVAEENRRMLDDRAGARSAVRRRRYAGGAVALALVAVVVAVAMGGSPGRQRATVTIPTESDGASPWAAFLERVSLLPEDTTGQEDEWIPEEEFRALSAQGTPLAQLFGLHVRTVVIDAGHGGADPGSIGASGLKEKDVTLDVALRLERRLVARGYDVRLTRSDDRTVSLRDRVGFTNGVETDLFVSIHVNSFPTDSVNVLETFYFGAGGGAAVERAAEAENRGSDFSVADFDRLISDVVTTVKLQESRRLARSIQRSLVRSVRTADGPISDWGTKPGPFVVLLGSRAPSVLAEIGVISHPEGERRLADEAYRERLATWLEEGILNYLISRSREEPGANPVD